MVRLTEEEAALVFTALNQKIALCWITRYTHYKKQPRFQRRLLFFEKRYTAVKHLFFGSSGDTSGLFRLIPRHLPFLPDLLQYGYESFSRFGAFKGAWLTIVRISKCHPFHPGGIDHVPEKKEKP